MPVRDILLSLIVDLQPGLELRAGLVLLLLLLLL